MIRAIVGTLFLFAGAFVYTYNTESSGSKLVFRVEHDNRVFGLGEDETAAILLGIGVVMLAMGALRWLRSNAARAAQEDDH